MTHKLIEAIHASPLKLSLCICGAGASVISSLTQVAGCSRTLLKAEVLYAQSTTAHALDYNPPHLVTCHVARQLAQHACKLSEIALTQECLSTHSFTNTRQKELNCNCCCCQNSSSSSSSKMYVGVGATSSIQTDRVRRGLDQVFVSVWKGVSTLIDTSSNDKVGCNVENSKECSEKQQCTLDKRNHFVQLTDYHMQFPKNWTREEQDEQVSLLILHAIAQACRSLLVSTNAANTLSTQLSISSTLFDSLLTSPFIEIQNDFVDQNDSIPVKESRHLKKQPAVTSLSYLDDVHSLIETVLRGNGVNYILWNQHGEVRCDVQSPFGDEAYEQNLVVATQNNSQNQLTLPIKLLYPGSFRPLHWGHTQLVRSASDALLRRYIRQQQQEEEEEEKCHYKQQQKQQRKAEVMRMLSRELNEQVHVTYEIAVSIVDKGALTADEIAPRAQQFIKQGKRVVVSNARLFVQKAKLFPGHGFVIGLDTAQRVIDPQYYDPPTTEGMASALMRNIGNRGCYFVVGGRLVKEVENGRDVWQDWASLQAHVPHSIQHLFIGLSQQQFRVDVSSTELRARATTTAQQVESSHKM